MGSYKGDGWARGGGGGGGRLGMNACWCSGGAVGFDAKQGAYTI